MQMLQGGEAAFDPTQDALVVAQQCTSRHVFINKEEINNTSMIQQCGLAMTLQQMDGAQKMHVAWLLKKCFGVRLDDVF